MATLIPQSAQSLPQGLQGGLPQCLQGSLQGGRGLQNAAPHAGQEQNKVFVSFGSKTYTVQVLQGSGAGERDITALRDWTGVAQMVLQYLKEEFQDPSGLGFDFDQMKTADISLQGDVSLDAATRFPHPKTPLITHVSWDDRVIKRATKEIPLPAIQRAGTSNTLARLGTELATYKAPKIVSQNIIRPPSSTQPGTQPRNTLIHDVGAGGDCGPNSIAHQLALMSHPIQKTPQDLRNEVSDYLNPDILVHDPLLFGYIEQTLEEEKRDNRAMGRKAFADSPSISGDQIERDLADIQNADRDNQDLRRRILTYRKERLKTAGVWVDKDFFYVLSKRHPIGIIRTVGNQYVIEERFPSDQPIDKNKTVWIYYDGTRQNGGYHFQSFLRNSPEFSPWIDRLLLEDRHRAITTFCSHVQENRTLLNSQDPEARQKSIAPMKRAVADLRNTHPAVFEKALNLMKEKTPSLAFNATNFENNDTHYEELLKPAYADLLTPEKLIVS